MDPGLKVVITIPLHELWRNDGSVTSPRGKWLTEDDIQGLLRLGPVHFVVADVGLPLSWVQPKDCHNFWNEEVKPHLAPPNSRFFLDDYPGGYCYIASAWNKGEIVVLEMHH